MAVTVVQTQTFVNDLDGKPMNAEDARELRFTIGGTTYILDTDPKGVTAFETAVKKFVAVARPVRPASNKADNEASRIRAWAATPEGSAVIAAANIKAPGSAGRIAADLKALYNANN